MLLLREYPFVACTPPPECPTQNDDSSPLADHKSSDPTGTENSPLGTCCCVVVVVLVYAKLGCFNREKLTKTDVTLNQPP